MTSKSKRYVLCVKNRGYKASLEVRKIYEVLPDKDAASLGMLRVIDESGEDYLYESEFFVAIKLPDSAKDLFALHSKRKQLPTPSTM